MAGSKKNKAPIMSDVGLQMQETIDKVKLMKGHAAAKEKLQEMEQAISMIKQAYFKGCKTAEDMTSNNEDFDATDEQKSKADKVINKLRVGWNSDKADARRDRRLDKLQAAVEEQQDSGAPIQINTNSPELQDFSTSSVADHYNF